MRHGRAKQARRTLQFFERAAGICPPYHLLLDGTFVIAVLKYKLPWHERLDKLLQHAPFDLSVCASTVAELKALQGRAKDDGDIFAEAIQWCHENCRELDDEPREKGGARTSSSTSSSPALSAAAADILRVACHANKNNTADEADQNKRDERKSTRYFCATQDEELLDQLRHQPIPIIRLARGSVLLLEQPSKMAEGSAKREERQKWTHTTSEQEQKLVALVRQQKNTEKKQSTAASMQPRQRKKSKAKGPNPLSCKKRTSSDGAKSENKRKRRRKNKES